MTHPTHLALLACLLLSGAVQAQCLPSQLGGAGSAALVASPPAGTFAAWKCGTRVYVAACVARECGLVGAKRAVAAWLSNPSVTGLTFGKDPHKDAALLAVWSPYRAQIAALKPSP